MNLADAVLCPDCDEVCTLETGQCPNCTNTKQFIVITNFIKPQHPRRVTGRAGAYIIPTVPKKKRKRTKSTIQEPETYISFEDIKSAFSILTERIRRLRNGKADNNIQQA